MLGLRKNKKKAPLTLPNRFHVKMGDTVWVTHGKDKGKTGIVRKTFHDRGKVLVEGINLIKKAVRPNPMAGQQGGIVEMEAPMPVAKVMLFCLQCNKPTRVKKTTLGDGKKVRVCQKCSAQFDS
ncbi:MAG: 50S ribosomal protein L24 [Cyanobacteria bacterium HKST-UBA06]|nr:50S ribosomal protein L24 [Cyanobacteria bacterium HKST-UBA05]MCA9798286.1 50S ribosomal protein L24 [Cyanobacteria bacterium HKST-UBA04]MCA9806975.1 50S ribosomal protein L24 [Cyanobacteria bacterium HKST-UBA06]MCA9841716.1 50S ribosomal protein L24 [Cyanobacteria bacterium HKST-UBA03]